MRAAIDSSYCHSPCLDSHARSAIGQAMNELSLKSCLQFVHRAESNAPDYIYFTRDNGYDEVRTEK